MSFEEILEESCIIRDSKGNVHGKRPYLSYTQAVKLCIENDVENWLHRLREATWGVRAF